MADDTVETARTAAIDAIVNPQCTYEDRIKAIDALIAAVRAEQKGAFTHCRQCGHVQINAR